MAELASRLIALDRPLPGLPSTNEPGLACRWSGPADAGISACSDIAGVRRGSGSRAWSSSRSRGPHWPWDGMGVAGHDNRPGVRAAGGSSATAWMPGCTRPRRGQSSVPCWDSPRGCHTPCGWRGSWPANRGPARVGPRMSRGRKALQGHRADGNAPTPRSGRDGPPTRRPIATRPRRVRRCWTTMAGHAENPLSHVIDHPTIEIPWFTPPAL